MQEFLSILERLPAKYADLRILKQRRIQVALRTDSSDIVEEEWVNVICKAVSRGYGVASIDRFDKDSVERAASSALKHAKMCDQPVEILPVPTEKGVVKHPFDKEFQTEEVSMLLKSLSDKITLRLKTRVRTELIASHCGTSSTLLTSEGTEIREETPLTDLTIYIVARGMNEGFASKMVGGMGG